MNVFHRLRMLRLQRQANQLLRRARDEHANRPHVQSVFLIGYPVPPKPREYGITPLYVVFLLVLFGVVFAINSIFERVPEVTCKPTYKIVRKWT